MIARLWKGRACGPEAAEAYHQIFEREVLDALQRVDGFRGAYLLAGQHDDAVELMTLTLFDSLAAVRGFAGDDYRQAMVTPQARAVLCSVDESAQHFDILTAPR